MKLHHRGFPYHFASLYLDAEFQNDQLKQNFYGGGGVLKIFFT